MYQPEGFALSIFKDRYALTEEETWEQACLRIANQLALAETPDKQKKYLEIFNENLVNNYFVPGGRIWYNSGRNNPQLLNCFVLTNQLDSKNGWGEIAKQMIVTSMQGGGCGIEFSDVRPRGALITSQRGECPGPVELMKLVNNCASPIKAGGLRRVALMFSLDLDHPDIEEFLDAKLVNGELTYANISVRSKKTKEFINAVKNDLNWELSWKGQYKKEISAKKLWEKIVDNAYKNAEPGFLNWELALNESNIWYIEDLVTTNPCVSGSTEILTKSGYEKIENLVDQSIEIWNGFEWSEVTPKITGINQEMLKITFNDGRTLECTKYHKFHLSKDYHGTIEIVEANNLKIGDKLIKHKFPIIDSDLVLNDAYTQGFVSAEGMELNRTLYIYEPKFSSMERLQNKKIVRWEENNKRYRIILNKTPLSKKFVPLEYSVTSKLEWLSGLFDGDGTELKEGGLQLVSVDFDFLFNIQKLLSTLGIQSKVIHANDAGKKLMPNHKGGNDYYDCKETKRICIGAVQMQELKTLGLKCERMNFNKQPQRDASQFISVKAIEEIGNAEIVYCFNEPKKHLGIFNGILTGQCGEIALSSYDCCCLGHLVLTRFITDKNEVDWHLMANVIRTGVRMLDNVLTVNSYPLTEMKEKSHKLRRIGLGTTGLADMLALLSLKYGSVEGNIFIDKLFKFISKVAYESSVMLAIEKGPFPLLDIDKHIQSDFIKRLPKKIKALIKEHGIRNCAILTQAPTGTVSIISGNVSSGIEPMFAPAYERRYFDKNERKTELVFHPLFADFMKKGKDVSHFIGSNDLSVRDHMEVQRIIQQYIDNAVSKTINMPYDYPKDDMSNLWLEYLPDLKGTTFYRENSRGYINSNGEIEEPPLKAIPLNEAIAKFDEKAKEEANHVDDCTSGVCGI